MNKPTQPIKIVFFDIDWTLLNTDEQTIPSSISEQVLPRLKAKGIIPAIATGRCVGAFPKALQPLLGKDGFELVVTINGQDNLYQGSPISEYKLSVERVEQVVEKLRSLGIEYAFVSREDIATSADNAVIHDSLMPIKADYCVNPTAYLQDDTVQMLAFYPQEQDLAVVQAGVLGEDLKAVRWHKNAVDILAKDNSKARGIQDVLDHFGFSIDNAMAFGDGHNDFEMLSTVGFGVAMGNADPNLKKVADFVTKPMWEDGILYALEELGVI